MSELRSILVRLHRWAGLTTASFLVVVGLTGALLAFFGELNHWLSPRLFPSPRPGLALDAAALAVRAEVLAPEASVNTIYLGNPGTVVVGVSARDASRPIAFNQLFLDPLTGEELGRRKVAEFPLRAEELMPFIYRLHMTLAAGEVGAWLLGLTALIWTIDSFVGFYLTLPPPSERSRKSFLVRWGPAWKVKGLASFYRLNFDLHRAGGLWFWLSLLVFAWSGVEMNLNGVYTRITSIFFDYRPAHYHQGTRPLERHAAAMSWEQARARGRQLLAAQAETLGFSVLNEVALYHNGDRETYEYRVRSSRDIGERYGQTSVWFDASSGELLQFALPTGLRSGDTLTTWLYELHKANVFGLTYRVLVCVLGLVIALLSWTGVYIWWKKRRSRQTAPRVARSCATSPVKI